MTEPQTRKRIFFALWPSQQQRQKIAAVIAPYRASLKGKWTAAENWHITLVFIGGFPAEDIPALQAAAARIHRRDISLRFERLEYWKRPKIMCLGGDRVPTELIELVESLEETARPFGFVPEKRPFRPHLTVARKAGFFDTVTLAQPLELRWSGFELVESRPLPGGVRYQPLKQ